MNVFFILDDTMHEHGRAIVTRKFPKMLAAYIEHGITPTCVTLRQPHRLHTHVRTELGIDAFALGLSSLRRAPLAVTRLRRLVYERKPDLIHGIEILPAIIEGLATIRDRSIPTVYSRRHTVGGWKLNRASRLAARLNDHTIAPSDAVARYAESIDRTTPDRIHIVYGGIIDPRPIAEGEVSALRGALGISEEDRVIGTVARLRHEKGIDVLLDAYERIARDAVRPPHLVVVGAGPEERRLRATAGTALGRTVHFAGYQDDPSLWYRIMDVVAIPSRREAFGQTAVEAMAAGRALVVAGVGALRETVVDGVTGIVVPPDDPASLAAAISSLLHDHGVAHRFSQKARERYLKRYTFDAMITRHVECWNRITTRSRRIGRSIVA